MIFRISQAFFMVGIAILTALQAQATLADDLSPSVEISRLHLPRLSPALNCLGDPRPSGHAFAVNVRAMTKDLTVLNISISELNAPSTVGIAAILIDDDKPVLVLFDKPGTKTILLPAHNPGLHIVKVATLDVFPGGTVTESSSQATCIAI